MAARQEGPSATSNRMYEDFEPLTDWVRDEGVDTFLVYLPGFTKQQLRVQISTSRLLRISGERPLGDNKWQRFVKETQIPPTCDTKGMAAKFEDGILYIRQPKLITPAEQQGQAKPIVEAPRPPQPMSEPRPPQVPSFPPPQLEKSNGSVAANTIPQKSQEKETDTRFDSKDVPPKIQEREKSKKQDATREEGRGKREEDEKARKMEEVTKEKESEGKPKTEEGKSVAGAAVGFLTELKKPENRMKLVLTVVSCVILGMLVINMLTPCRCENQEL